VKGKEQPEEDRTSPPDEVMDAWARLSAIAINTNKELRQMEAEERDRLLRFQKNMLIGLSRTDFFGGYQNDVPLLTEMVLTSTAYAKLNPSLKTSSLGDASNQGNSYSLPENVDYSSVPEEIKQSLIATLEKAAALREEALSNENFSFYLDEFWQMSNHATGTVTTDSKDSIAKGVKEFSNFASDSEDAFELIRYTRKILEGIALVPSLDKSSGDAGFIASMLDVGHEFLKLTSEGKTFSEPVVFLSDIFKANQPAEIELAAASLNRFVNDIASDDELLIPETLLEDLRQVTDIAGNPARFSGLSPFDERPNWYHEEQRLWAFGIVIDYAAYICEVADWYGLTAHAIAGAILWEALENPYDAYGRGLLAPALRPGSYDDYGIIGKIHVSSANDVARSEAVINRVYQRRYAVVPRYNLLPDSNTKRAYESLLLNNVEAAIEHIGAILDYRRDLYEYFFEREPENYNRQGEPVFVPRLFDQAGILAVLYQGGLEDNQNRLALLNERASDGNPFNNAPQFPNPEDETMGTWTSQYRYYIALLLETGGCLQGDEYLHFRDVPQYGFP
jgi:hypothetical protein